MRYLWWVENIWLEWMRRKDGIIWKKRIICNYYNFCYVVVLLVINMLDGDEIIQVMIWGNKEGIRIKKYDRL